MKAVILAGGFGTRLYPITQDLPKPMAPILGEPALAHIITLLCKNGIYDAALTLKYMPEQIMNTFRDCFCGVNLKYYIEKEPLGTAGGVKNASEFFDGDILVISGDCICDLDLKAAYEYHKKKNAHLTVLLKTVSDPLSFGTALCDPDGRIRGFCEKPSWDEVRSNAVNTGIYIFDRSLLELIPKNTMYDFSKDLFPQMLKKGCRLYGYECEGDWCDIGSLEEYRRCNIEALGGKYSLFSSVRQRHGCFDSVVSDTAMLGADSKCIASVLHDGVKIGKGCDITGCVICHDAVIGDGVRIEQGCVIGSGAKIANGVHISEDVIIPCGCVIDEGEASVKIKSGKLFSDEGISGDIYSFFGIDTLTSLGRAVGESCDKVGAVCDGDEVCKLAKDAFLCGVRYGGRDAYDLGIGQRAACGYAAASFGLDIAVHIGKKGECGEISLGFFDKNGMCPDKLFEDKVTKALYSPPHPAQSKPGRVKYLGGIGELYENKVLSLCPEKLDGVRVCLSQSMHTQYYSSVLEKLGVITVPMSGREADVICADISPNDRSLSVKDGGYGSRVYDFYHVISMVLAHCEGVARIALPYSMPSDIEKLAEARGIKVMHYITQPSALNRRDEEVRHLRAKHPWLYDPFCAFVKLLHIMKITGKDLSQLAEPIGDFCVREEYIKADDAKKGAVLRALYERGVKDNDEYADTACVKLKRGEARFYPGKDGLRVVIRSYSVEAASELADEIQKRVEGMNRDSADEVG